MLWHTGGPARFSDPHGRVYEAVPQAHVTETVRGQGKQAPAVYAHT